MPIKSINLLFCIVFISSIIQAAQSVRYVGKDKAEFLKNAKRDNVSTVTIKDLKKITDFARSIGLDKETEFNNCEKRSALLGIELEQKHGILVGQLRVYGDLAVPTRRLPIDGVIIWNWHIAPYVLVRKADGDVVPYSLDFSLFDEPVEANDWINAIGKYSQIEGVSQRNRFDDLLVDASQDDRPVDKWRYEQIIYHEEFLADAEPFVVLRPLVDDRLNPERPDAAELFSKKAQKKRFHLVLNRNQEILKDHRGSDKNVPFSKFSKMNLGKQTRCWGQEEEGVEQCRTYVIYDSHVCYMSFTKYNGRGANDSVEIENDLQCYYDVKPLP